MNINIKYLAVTQHESILTFYCHQQYEQYKLKSCTNLTKLLLVDNYSGIIYYWLIIIQE